MKKISVNYIFFILIFIFLISGIIGCDSKSLNVNDKDMANIQIAMGLTAVEGEGIMITLEDWDRNDRNKIIKDIDLVDIVNILESEGAEAISINDERIIYTNKIKANEMNIKINDSEYDSPFIIKAIGDKEQLMESFAFESDYMNEYFKLNIEAREKMIINEYKGDLLFQYAKPINK